MDYNDDEEDQKVDVSKLLNYPAADDNLYTPPIDVLTEIDAQAHEAVRLMYVVVVGYVMITLIGRCTDSVDGTGSKGCHRDTPWDA